MPLELFPKDDGPKAPPEWPDDRDTPEDPIHYVPYTPEPVWEAERRTGLAWSAGIAFFGSVAFCLFIGWIADWVLGTSPWGMIGGIIIGAVLGFVQFFRITSQIFITKKDGPLVRPLMHSDDDKDEPQP
jgi:F0F1-type ATP synthase assembly protein I